MEFRVQVLGEFREGRALASRKMTARIRNPGAVVARCGIVVVHDESRIERARSNKGHQLGRRIDKRLAVARPYRFLDRLGRKWLADERRIRLLPTLDFMTEDRDGAGQ